MIDPSALQALAAVQSYGSVVGAAEALGYSPSAVSQQIKKLERQTGVALLERHGRGVLITSSGRALADYGRRMRADLEALQSTLLAEPGEPHGTLQVVAFSTGCRGLMGPVLGRITAEGTDLQLRVTCDDPREAVARVAEGKADLGLVHDWNSVPLAVPENLELEWLCVDVADLLVRDDHALAGRAAVQPGDLLDEIWVSTPQGAICNEALLKLHADLGRVPDIRVYDDDFATHIALVEQGVAVALVPRLGRPVLPHGVVVVPVVGPTPARQVGVVHRRTMAESPGVRHIVALLRDAAAQAVPNDS
ncbi:LysR family transcriptional regulator [Arthrobacter agilis]|uniref:LysR family transcriptional regulator n=1 Tax=Arthrobacter agilis TaxID=37921 RepID=UPI000B351DB8|nr:LysR family transcriptional regulator [Arthrobacter agilis]OUM42271.1 LysR family transcriptional regulator [Arthrobacter agilis]PPB45612.1 LysR family transcriptional regulator [Arthrobacter agilis]TPV26407.1 LysR family transcriptional regulator [Arthrobacter agilis]VDR33700.1 CysJI operon transcriptional activator [Arthrobacter agilis]